MIIKQKTHWFKMLFEWNGSVLPQLVPRLLLLLFFSVLVVYSKDFLLTYNLHINPAIFKLFGIALAIFLGFRNSVSYDRFWEGRKLWGALLNDTRSLARQAHTLVADDSKSDKTIFIKYLTAFVYALKHQLRHTDANADMQRLLPAEFAEELSLGRYKPVIILKAMGIWVQKKRREGSVEAMAQLAFEENFNKLSDMVGGCERIARTPYRTHTVSCCIGLFILPFGFVESMSWLIPIITVLVGFSKPLPFFSY